MKDARLSAPNSLLLVFDPDLGELPSPMDGEAIAATDSAIVIGALSEFDGESQITVASASNVRFDVTLQPRWRGTLRTVGRLAIMTVSQEIGIEIPAPFKVDVAVLTNDPSEPDQIWVLVL